MDLAQGLLCFVHQRSIYKEKKTNKLKALFLHACYSKKKVISKKINKIHSVKRKNKIAHYYKKQFKFIYVKFKKMKYFNNEPQINQNNG